MISDRFILLLFFLGLCYTGILVRKDMDVNEHEELSHLGPFVFLLPKSFLSFVFKYFDFERT